MTIREFRLKDYDSVITLWQHASLSHRPQGRDSKEHIKREFQGHNAVFLVAEHEGTLVGSVFGTHDGRKGWINRLATAPEYRDQGVARTLVTEVEKRFHKMGIKIIACLIEKGSTESMQFFEKIGYTKHTDIFYCTKRESPDT
jgi:ribosomal protein S18 acetylase RimI-like enzyme